MSAHTNANLTRDEWRVNLIKDGGRRVMNGGNAYEDDLEPASPEPGQEPPAPTGSAHPHHE